MICSAHSATSDQDSAAAVQLFTAVGTGLAMATLHHAFAPVSGGHLNPAVTAAAVVTKRVSLLRAALYVCAQCGGAIAGAALVYGIYGARDQFESVAVSSFGLEFILTFIVVFVFFSVSSPPRIGLAYMVALCCSLIRALGSAAPPAEQHHLHNPSVCSCPVRGKVGQGAGSWHLGTLDQSNSGQTYNQRPDTSVANLTCVHLTAEE